MFTSRTASLLLLLLLAATCMHGAPLPSFKDDASSTTKSAASSGRNGRALGGGSWFDYFPTGGAADQLMSRTSAADDPSNSPIYYIRLPPTPYMFVPGLGYVSRPEAPQVPVTPSPPPVRRSPFIQLPLDFVSNGKPGSTVLTWPSEPAPKPVHTKPSVTKLKGPYFFNGKPSGLFVLQQDPYSSLYADVLHNFYP